jgi:sulfate adenylyltransferase subunit 1
VETNTNKSTVRVITCGSVDDGKSTLIGRLMYDCKAIFEDQLKEIKNASFKRGKENIDLSLLTDGLKEERERGITIDVAYRYFSTPKRKFIFADTPGHKEFTRNMITGASGVSAAILLIDSKRGITEQTIRHAYVNAILNIPHIIVCINKMDLNDYNEEIFNSIKNDFEKKIISKLKFETVHYIQVSALYGDNVTNKSEKTIWYQGHSLLTTLEDFKVKDEYQNKCLRFNIQQSFTWEGRESVFLGNILSGKIKRNDKLKLVPDMRELTVSKIELKGKEISEARAGQSIQVFINDGIEINNYGVLTDCKELPMIYSMEINCMLFWFSEQVLQKGDQLIFQSISTICSCTIIKILGKTDPETLQISNDALELCTNDFGTAEIRTTEKIFFDKYSENRFTGSFLLIHPETNETLAGGIIM